MKQTSFYTEEGTNAEGVTKKSSTSTDSYTTINTNNTESTESTNTSNESCCENTICQYCYNIPNLYMSDSVLRSVKNNKTSQGLVYKYNLIEYGMNLAPKIVKTVVKTSKHINFVIENEVEAWKRVAVFNSPHFAKVIKKVPIAKRENRLAVFFEEIRTGFQNGKHISGSSKRYKKQFNSIDGAVTSHKNGKCISLTDLLQSPDKHPSAVLNCFRQTLAAVIMYETVGITHYDLHSDNIMVGDTPYDINVYKINDIIIPIITFGIVPVIIDFGLSHVANSNWATTNSFLSQGISTFDKDPIIDCMLLITTVKNRMEFHNSWIVSNHISEMKAYYKYIKSATSWFEKLGVDENGWFLKRQFPDTVYDLLQSFPHVEYGIFSTKNIASVIELLQYAIRVPITKLESSTTTFKQALLRLCVLWMDTVEPVLKNIHREKMLFKYIVSLISKHENTADITEGVDVSDIIELKHKYPNILNFSQLISSVCLLRNAYSNKIYKVSIIVKNIKKKLYENVVHKSTLDFLNDTPSVNYMLVPGMKVLIQDIVEKKQYTFKINKFQAKKINEKPQELNNIIKSITDSK